MEALRSRLRGIYYALTKKAIPLHRGEQSRPFFIVGSGRCGTTLLRRILQASDEIHIPPENWSLAYSIHHFDQNRWYLGWEQLVDIVVSAHAHRSYDWFEDPPTSLIKEVCAWSKEKRSLYRLVDRIYRYHGEVNDASFDRWGDKTPLNVKHMESMLGVFIDCRFIHLIRDGLDVVYSYKTRFDYSGNISEPALRWRSAVTNAREFESEYPDLILEIRYEDLVRNPEREVRRICNFIEVEYRREILNDKKPIEKAVKIDNKPHYKNVKNEISTESIEKGRRKMDTQNKKKVASFIQDKMVEVGYRPIEVD